jgi:FAD/FMN-containing dehydrogenase
LEHFYELTEVVRERLNGSKAKRIVTFGHLGDGNTHLNVTAEKFDQEIYDRLVFLKHFQSAANPAKKLGIFYS